MTEIEQLRADLATIQKAAEIAKEAGFHRRTGTYDMVEEDLKQKIADLEAQAQANEWADSRMFVREILADSSFPQRLIWLARYARHLESKVAELDHELRCERIDGGKVRDDQKAFTAEKNREKLAELTTVLNAIPLYRLEAACGLARELVGRWIEGVKMEMQGICEVFSQKVGIPDEACIANGDLIAAAPDLYEALQDIVENAVVYYEGSMDLYSEAIENARNALAKARGEENG